ncbi:[FeFe] hydrogenase, group A [Leptogranulimonas caecicola]|uniref:Ferredoxin n=1 Tax=Leptogranulimonas caecicola TaxID=2894156 RepID=A0AAU9CR62_9ACTN|nr:[FeFe] hydrogenase, group A [Leptogranulimonas caecicola]BCV19592.1 ferredoxin [Atopobiaceae bacterium P1]BDC90257.1 ferredoxin [Leptogranulimonas caecicola]
MVEIMLEELIPEPLGDGASDPAASANPAVPAAPAEPQLVTVTVDNKTVQVPTGSTILDACTAAGVRVPTLCFLKDVNEIGACRVCLVEVEGIEQLVASCNNVVLDGMVVRANSPRVREARKANLEFLLSRHNSTCTSCVRSGNCQLQALSNQFGISELPYSVELTHTPWNQDFPLIRDADKCVHCLRCIQICDHVQNTGVWDLANRSSHTCVGVAGGAPIEATDCTLCGQCVTHCPTGALTARDDTDKVFDAIADPDTTVVVQVAPAVRAAWGESLGLSHEEATIQRMAAALKALGVDYVFDTSWSADLTIMEEGSELLAKLAAAAAAPGDPAASADLAAPGAGDAPRFPMFTSCCPGWVRYAKAHHPELVDQLSSAKSPGQMFGAITKSWFAQTQGIDPHSVFCVEVMPCLAKKAEVAYAPMNDACGDPDVDVSLTTREMDRMFRAACLDVASLEELPLDDPLGTFTGAGVIFGATGGVMEAALRTAHAIVTGEDAPADAFSAVRGMDGWKEATFDMGGTPLSVAVVSGLSNAEKLIQSIQSGEFSYHFVEVMACPGGCAGGGGQPIHDGCELAAERGDVLWELDRQMPLRKSHENPVIQQIYAEYLGEPLSHRAHELLHTDHHAWKMPHEA